MSQNFSLILVEFIILFSSNTFKISDNSVSIFLSGFVLNARFSNSYKVLLKSVKFSHTHTIFSVLHIFFLNFIPYFHANTVLSFLNKSLQLLRKTLI